LKYLTLKYLSLMRRTLSGLIWTSFKEVQNLIGSSVLLSALFWLFTPETNIPSKIAVPIFVLMIIIIITLANATLEGFNSSRKILPSILYSGKPNQQSLSCLLEPSELFAQNSLVSFYYRGDDDFEVLIGIGKVEIIREIDEKIQIILLKSNPVYEEIIRKLENNDANIRDKIQIKPSIPNELSTYL